jgi:hypothetical protein
MAMMRTGRLVKRMLLLLLVRDMSMRRMSVIHDMRWSHWIRLMMPTEPTRSQHTSTMRMVMRMTMTMNRIAHRRMRSLMLRHLLTLLLLLELLLLLMVLSRLLSSVCAHLHLPLPLQPRLLDPYVLLIDGHLELSSLLV